MASETPLLIVELSGDGRANAPDIHSIENGG
jgi:hypothetical protein